MGSEGSPRNENVYVAVGRDVEESKSTLLWALHNFGGQFRILHVHQPSQAAANESPLDEVNSWCKDESRKVDKILDSYIHICRQAKVEAKKRCIETKDIGKGLVELIEHHNVAKLVMGAAADRHYLNGMTELKSSKAIYVNHHAQPSCQIWFICKERLIQRREADVTAVNMATAPTSPFPCFSTESYSTSTEISICTNNGSLPSYGRVEAGSSGCESCSSSSNHLEKDVKNTDEMYEEFESAMREAENKRQDAFRGLMKQVAATEETAIEAIRKAKAFEKLYKESIRRNEVEEILVKEKEALEARNRQLEEELVIVRDQLEKETAISDHTIRELKKEIDKFHVERDNHVTSRSLDRQQQLSEFSFLEIQRGTDNFEPALMIGECGFGAIFKASLHSTDVAIKLLQSGEERGVVQFKQELDIMSKLRHPNIVTLIGVCSDRYALIYEHLQNGSLEDRLACTNDTPPLPWQTRITIASLVCSTLSFLHSNKPHCYVHGNLKPANILLDANFAPKLSDFSTARPNPINYRDFPHLDPLGGELPLSPKSDIYSFGVLVLQLLTGRRCALSLVRDVKDALDGGNTSYMVSLMDPLVEWPPQFAMKLAQLAVDCCDMDQSRRPDLGLDVGRVLEEMRASILCQLPPQNNQPPDYFLCPILQEVMQDPHVAADGFTYEAEVLMEWFQCGKNTSPMTNLPLPHFNLIPNRTLRSGIQQWLEKY